MAKKAKAKAKTKRRKGKKAAPARKKKRAVAKRPPPGRYRPRKRANLRRSGRLQPRSPEPTMGSTSDGQLAWQRHAKADSAAGCGYPLPAHSARPILGSQGRGARCSAFPALIATCGARPRVCVCPAAVAPSVRRPGLCAADPDCMALAGRIASSCRLRHARPCAGHPRLAARVRRGWPGQARP